MSEQTLYARFYCWAPPGHDYAAAEEYVERLVGEPDADSFVVSQSKLTVETIDAVDHDPDAPSLWEKVFSAPAGSEDDWVEIGWQQVVPNGQHAINDEEDVTPTADLTDIHLLNQVAERVGLGDDVNYLANLTAEGRIVVACDSQDAQVFETFALALGHLLEVLKEIGEH